MTAAVRAGDVLRGMSLEPQPRPIGRVRVPLPEPVAAVPSPAPDEDARRQSLESELLNARAEARQEGYEAGLREGRCAAQKQVEAEAQKEAARAEAAVQERLAGLETLASSLATAKVDLLRLAEDDMVALCFDVLCRMVGDLAPPCEAVRAQLRSTADRVPPEEGAAVHVHPLDAEVLLACAPVQPGGPRWVPDAEVQLGGCIVTHAGGGLDLRFDTSLAACRKALLAQREQRLAAGGPP